MPLFASQEFEGTWDILIIDSGSTDDTLNIVRKYPRVTVHEIPNGEFGHGRTRNLALQLKEADYYLFTVQDATPPSQQWLQNHASIIEAYNLDALCGGQAVPHDLDKNPVQWHRPLNSGPILKKVTAGEFQSASPSEKARLCEWDNVNAIYKASSLLDTPFPDVRFGEDKAWAKTRLEDAGAIGYSFNNRVWHYHHQSHSFAYARESSAMFWNHKHFEVIPSSRRFGWLRFVLVTIKTIVCTSKIYSLKDVLFWLDYNIRIQKSKLKAKQAFLNAHSLGHSAIDQWYNGIGKKSPVATPQQQRHLP